jgi:hypothetical protein
MKKSPWIWAAMLALFSVWAVAALLVDFRQPWLGALLGALYAAAAAGCFRQRARPSRLFFWIASSVLVLAWWLGLRPTNDRAWQTDVSVLPWAEINGDQAVIHAIRDFSYRAEFDYVPRWETQTVDLTRIQGVDVYFTHWGVPLVAHTMVSFQVDDHRWLATSIEARQAVGQRYSVWRGFFRQYGLIYLIAEESDLVRLRTNYRHGEEVYLYHTRTTPADARRLFLAYLDWMNRARTHPQWYNALTANCGTAFVDYLANEKIGGVSRWDPRGILDGNADRMLYNLRDLAGNLPFAELRRSAWINPVARNTGAPDFSRKIREGRPGFAPPRR